MTAARNHWQSVIPILRVADASRSIAFYCDLLGFDKLWEHRFGDEFPAYVGVGRDGIELHLSEHQGGGCEAAELYVAVADVDETYRQMCAAGYQGDSKPADQDYGVRDFLLVDPDGHRLTLGTPLPE